MLNPQTLATGLRANVLGTIEFCSAVAEDYQYHPNHYRAPNDIQDQAAEHLHTVMGYRADQPEI